MGQSYYEGYSDGPGGGPAQDSNLGYWGKYWNPTSELEGATGDLKAGDYGSFINRTAQYPFGLKPWTDQIKQAEIDAFQPYDPQPWQQEVAREIAPSFLNPTLQRWVDSYGKALQSAGKNPAAVAAGRAQARSQGLASFLPQAMETYGRYQDLLTQLRRKREGIDTTTTGNAVASGFIGGGGLSSLGSLLGSSGKSC